jgi:hypothetical protein
LEDDSKFVSSSTEDADASTQKVYCSEATDSLERLLLVNCGNPLPDLLAGFESADMHGVC